MSSSGLSGMRWRKSSRSNHQGECVEVALGVDAVAARDSKDRQGPVLLFTREQWGDFVSALRVTRRP